MKHYKILHLPSGLYFHPTQRYSTARFEDGHLSKGGKVYMHKPPWHYVESGLKPNECTKYPKSDFVVVEFEVIEKQRITF